MHRSAEEEEEEEEEEEDSSEAGILLFGTSFERRQNKCTHARNCPMDVRTSREKYSQSAPRQASSAACHCTF